MFGRISFDDNQKVSKDELKNMELTLSDTISFEKQIIDEEGNTTDFYSWTHTYDVEETKVEGGKKKLVRDADCVKLLSSKEYLADVELFVKQFPHIKIKLRGVIQTSNQTHMNMIKQMQEIQDKFTQAISGFNEKVEFNQKCNVHIGNLGLLNINQLGYATDKCTEELQDIINQGWRILSVCPQPNQRRPDYILGRFNGNEEQKHVDCVRF